MSDDTTLEAAVAGAILAEARKLPLDLVAMATVERCVGRLAQAALDAVAAERRIAGCHCEPIPGGVGALGPSGGCQTASPSSTAAGEAVLPGNKVNDADLISAGGGEEGPGEVGIYRGLQEVAPEKGQ